MKKLCILVSLLLLLLSSVALAMDNYNYVNKNISATRIRNILVSVSIPNEYKAYISNPYVEEEIYELAEKKMKELNVKYVTIPQMNKRIDHTVGKDWVTADPNKVADAFNQEFSQFDGDIDIYLLEYHKELFTYPATRLWGYRVTLRMVLKDKNGNTIVDTLESRFKHDGLFDEANPKNMASRIMDVFFNNVRKKLSGKI